MVFRDSITSKNKVSSGKPRDINEKVTTWPLFPLMKEVTTHRIHGCDIYLPTFTIKINQMSANIPVPWILRVTISTSWCFIALPCPWRVPAKTSRTPLRHKDRRGEARALLQVGVHGSGFTTLFFTVRFTLSREPNMSHAINMPLYAPYVARREGGHKNVHFFCDLAR